jgi:hypothetical protein
MDIMGSRISARQIRLWFFSNADGDKAQDICMLNRNSTTRAELSIRLPMMSIWTEFSGQD